ncbi:aspartate/glutamate racemase family protein [Roseomonas sp. CCTCC AB2023176]|uniref:aspartate/glutamate racemase family protein n=1 Tax=Roseomonas sp. CCTCC AB2023176 TaxID=3342640 RepID=UPI0035E0B9E7
MSERILGVLGGMGPLASAEFMRQLTLLTPAERDQEHVPAILWSDPRVPDRVAARRGTGPDPLPVLVRGLRGLEAAGCGAIAIPCNTAHGWIVGMRAATRLPILHIVDAAAEDLRRQGVRPGTVGVMGTVATLEMGLYQDGLRGGGWDVIVPPPEDMARLVSPAIAEVKANRVEAAYAPLAEAARSLVARGATAVVLGCTEIPLGVAAGPALPFPVVDTIAALARVSIAWAREGATPAAVA